MIENWKKQFTLQELSLVQDQPESFITSQWQKRSKPNPYYLVYRWLVSLLFVITWIISIVDLKNLHENAAFRAKYLIYLTNWGYTMCTLQSVVAVGMLSACLMASRLKGAPNLHQNSLKLYKFYWVTNTIATDIAFGVTALYWSLIYQKELGLDAMNFIVHGNNSIVMMIDLFIVSHQVRLLHCFYPVIFGLCYAVFSVIFYLAGGISKEGFTYIYTILDWANPGATLIVCLAVMGFIVVIHVLVWGLHKLRIWLHANLCLNELEEPLGDASLKAYDNPAATVHVI